MGFGLKPDGYPILPRYDPMTDDPRRHSLYFDRATIKFFRSFKPGINAGLNEEPAFPRMIRAGFYDGLGTLLPLGVYWYERINAQSYQMWPIAMCWDVIPYERIVNWHTDDELHTYYRALQIDKYEDSAKAFRDYLKMRADPSYETRYELPNYMIDGDGVIIDNPPSNPFRARMGGWFEDRDRRDALAVSMDDEFDIA